MDLAKHAGLFMAGHFYVRLPVYLVEDINHLSLIHCYFDISCDIDDLASMHRINRANNMCYNPTLSEGILL